MRISIKTSGGFANVELGGEIDTRDLEADLASEVERNLAPESLEQADKARVDPEVADAQVYEVTLRGEDEDPIGRYVINDLAVAPEVGDTLAALVREIVRQRLENR
ncbi:MAG: protealysin inhibitor emfourin [Thermoanaerobaculia bacterium]